MKRLLSMFLVFVLALAVLSPASHAEYGLEAFSNDQLRDLYDCVRQEMKSRGLRLQQDITLREGKYIVGDAQRRPKRSRPALCFFIANFSVKLPFSINIVSCITE